MVILMHVLTRKKEHPVWYCLLACCLVLFSLSQSSGPLLAQSPEAGSATVEEAGQADIELPGENAEEDGKSDKDESDTDKDKDKEDERPRELGVMILIVWVLAGAGIGILIFTSLFGHSVRSMIRRPYPPQTHGSYRPPQEKTPPETEGESEPPQEDPPQN